MGSTVFPAPASGPTTSDITTAGNAAGWGNIGDSPWVVVQTIVTNNTAATVTFSGLSGYKRYRVFSDRINLSGAVNGIFMRINGDTSSVYDKIGEYRSSGNPSALSIDWTYATTALNFVGGPGNSGYFDMDITVDNAAITAPKRIFGTISGNSGTWLYEDVKSFYRGTGNISSITIGNGSGTLGGNFSSGTFYLLGAN